MLGPNALNLSISALLPEVGPENPGKHFVLSETEPTSTSAAISGIYKRLSAVTLQVNWPEFSALTYKSPPLMETPVISPVLLLYIACIFDADGIEGLIVSTFTNGWAGAKEPPVIVAVLPALSVSCKSLTCALSLESPNATSKRIKFS